MNWLIGICLAIAVVAVMVIATKIAKRRRLRKKAAELHERRLRASRSLGYNAVQATRRPDLLKDDLYGGSVSWRPEPGAMSQPMPLHVVFPFDTETHPVDRDHTPRSTYEHPIGRDADVDNHHTGWNHSPATDWHSTPSTDSSPTYSAPDTGSSSSGYDGGSSSSSTSFD